MCAVVRVDTMWSVISWIRSNLQHNRKQLTVGETRSNQNIQNDGFKQHIGGKHSFWSASVVPVWLSGYHDTLQLLFCIRATVSVIWQATAPCLSLSLSVSVIRMLDSVTVSQSVSILKLLRTKGQSTIHLLLKVLQWKIIGILGKNSPSWIGEKGHRRTRSQAYHNRIPGNLWGEQYR